MSCLADSLFWLIEQITNSINPVNESWLFSVKQGEREKEGDLRGISLAHIFPVVGLK